MIAAKHISTGTCVLCNGTFERACMTRHLNACLSRHDLAPAGKPAQLFHIIVDARGLPDYWLHVAMTGSRTLRELDAFLRAIWLECCGHLSVFTIDGRRYAVHPDEESILSNPEFSMDVPVSDVLQESHKNFSYEYDYGTTTGLALRVADIRQASILHDSVALLARNDPPDIRCVSCNAPATQVCTCCFHTGEAWFCDECADEHDCEADGDAFLPVVNSPRTGLCAYTGQA